MLEWSLAFHSPRSNDVGAPNDPAHRYKKRLLKEKSDAPSERGRGDRKAKVTAVWHSPHLLFSWTHLTSVTQHLTSDPALFFFFLAQHTPWITALLLCPRISLLYPDPVKTVSLLQGVLAISAGCVRENQEARCGHDSSRLSGRWDWGREEFVKRWTPLQVEMTKCNKR